MQSMALQSYSGYRPSDLKECVLSIHDLQLNRKRSSMQAIREKYGQHKVYSSTLFCTASSTDALTILEGS